MKAVRCFIRASAIFVGTLLVLPSVSFAATVPTFTFTGAGYSHGVGMSQHGAIAMGNAGKSATDIINQYFTDVQIETKSSPRVRVNVDKANSTRSSWTIRPGYVDGTMTVNGTVYPDDSYTFTASGSSVIMTSASGATPQQTLASPVRIDPQASSGADLTQVVDSSGYYGAFNIRYRGYFEMIASSSKLKLVNNVSMQHYLYGVVPRELGDTFHPVAATSQAMAIVARSYAWSNANSGTILSCTTSAQVYCGHSILNRSNGISTPYEQANANAAVDATADQYITYNGAIKTTHFGSCNGNATANSEDVWSATNPWERSKVDPWCALAPNHTTHSWTYIYSGMTLAATMKSKGAPSVPAGAGTTVWVSGIHTTTGTGGWVTKAVVDWSDGTTSTLYKADTVRVKMGLKSAQFSVSAPEGSTNETSTEQQFTVSSYEENSSAIRRVKSWSRVKASGSSGGAIYTSNKLGAYASMKFNGTGIVWVGPRAKGYGRAKVYVDDIYKKTVNLAASKTYRKQPLFVVEGLDASATHTIKIVVTTASGSKSAKTVGIDRFDVFGTAVYPPFKTYQETDSKVRRTKTWKVSTSAEHSDGAAKYSKTLGASFTAKFKAQSIAWYGQKVTSGGRAKVYVDGTYKKTVSLASGTTRRQFKLYEIKCLDPTKTHTLKVVVVAKRGSSKGGAVSIDKLVVRDGSLVK